MPTAVDTVLDAEQASTADAAGRDAGQSRMRRVASAPAFKHASCYQEVSPTAAVAAAAAAAADAPASTSTSGRAGGTRAAARQLRAPQPCSSCSGGRCNCLEVYVVSRSFSEFAGPVMQRLRPEAKDHLVDIGICHYMTVFKTADGQMVQFDFGPLGGDVQKAHGPLAAFLRRARAASQKQQAQEAAAAMAFAAAAASSNGGAAVEQPAGSSGRGMVHSPSAPSLPMASLDLAAYGGGEAAVSFVDTAGPSNRPKRGVAGEIREKQLQQLPPACMYMGRTSLTLDDIRQYNAAQGGKTYTLHENDCRHYVNSLVQYATGVERSTQHLKRHYFHSRHADKWLWYGWFVSAAQLVTDVGNWSHIQAGAAVTLLAVTGRSTLASLKTLATPVLPALKGLPALLPSAGLAAAGAAAAAPGTAAAAAAAGPSSTVIGTLATTLKLPAAMLLKRPLAAGAAAGGAGAAAAAVRDSTGAAAAGPGSGGSGAPARTWGAVGRPLQAVGDGMAHGVRSAVLGLRRLAVGNTRALQQLRREPLVVPEQDLAAAAAAGAAGSRAAVWGRRSSVATGGQPPRKWFGFRKPGTGQVAVPAAAGAAAVGDTEQQQQQQQPAWQEHEQQPVQRKPLAQLGHNVGRHVVWLGSAAARASGQLALFAFGGSRVAQYAGPAPVASAVAAGEGSISGGMMHSASSQQLQLTPRELQPACVLGMGNRSLSMPSLLAAPAAGSADVAPAPGLASGAPVSFSVSSSSGCARDGSSSGTPLAPLGGADLMFMWDSGGSSSITCSSFGSKSTGVGRQTLNLPAPRISWGKRASQAIAIVRQ